MGRGRVWRCAARRLLPPVVLLQLAGSVCWDIYAGAQSWVNAAWRGEPGDSRRRLALVFFLRRDGAVLGIWGSGLGAGCRAAREAGEEFVDTISG